MKRLLVTILVFGFTLSGYATTSVWQIVQVNTNTGAFNVPEATNWNTGGSSGGAWGGGVVTTNIAVSNLAPTISLVSTTHQDSFVMLCQTNSQSLQSTMWSQNVTGSTNKGPLGGSVSTNGLVAYYQLETTNWLDSITSSNGTGYNTPTLTNDCMEGSFAMRVNGNGTKNYVRTVNPTLLNSATAWTICAWVKMKSRTASGGLVSHALSSAATTADGIFQSTAASSNLYGMHAVSGAYSYEDNMNVQDDLWTFVVTTWETNVGKATGYTNGLYSAIATTAVKTPVSQTNNFYLGQQWYSSDNRYSDCILDSVAIYKDRALASNEVLALYNSYYGASTTNTYNLTVTPVEVVGNGANNPTVKLGGSNATGRTEIKHGLIGLGVLSGDPDVSTEPQLYGKADGTTNGATYNMNTAGSVAKLGYPEIYSNATGWVLRETVTIYNPYLGEWQWLNLSAGAYKDQLKHDGMSDSQADAAAVAKYGLYHVFTNIPSLSWEAEQERLFQEGKIKEKRPKEGWMK